MVTAPVITFKISAAILALTPPQRWAALRQLNVNFMTERWFILVGVAAIMVLTVVLFIVSNNRKTRDQNLSNKMFSEYSDKRGLSARERLLLLDIVCSMGLLRTESIFTLSSVFDRGAARMIEECFAEEGAEDSNQLRSELSFLREKLGFQKQHPSSIGLPTQSKKLSSRQIPTGKKLNMVRLKARGLGEIEGTVIKNNGMELMIRLAKLTKTTPGEVWRIRYYFGASVWEFDTSVISCHGSSLILNHSDSVRFINRRRFLRVGMNKPAYIACFPFAKKMDGTVSEIDAEQNLPTESNKWEPPQFVPAVITELAGPGLRIEAPLKLIENKDRVLVMFRLDEEKAQRDPSGRYVKALSSKVVGDIGEVRHVRAMENGFSIAVELTRLSDRNVNELIRDTNAESIRASREGLNFSVSDTNIQEHALNSMVV